MFKATVLCCYPHGYLLVCRKEWLIFLWHSWFSQVPERGPLWFHCFSQLREIWNSCEVVPEESDKVLNVVMAFTWTPALIRMLQLSHRIFLTGFLFHSSFTLYHFSLSVDPGLNSLSQGKGTLEWRGIQRLWEQLCLCSFLRRARLAGLCPLIRSRLIKKKNKI